MPVYALRYRLQMLQETIKAVKTTQVRLDILLLAQRKTRESSRWKLDKDCRNQRMEKVSAANTLRVRASGPCGGGGG